MAECVLDLANVDIGVPFSKDIRKAIKGAARRITVQPPQRLTVTARTQKGVGDIDRCISTLKPYFKSGMDVREVILVVRQSNNTHGSGIFITAETMKGGAGA